MSSTTHDTAAVPPAKPKQRPMNQVIQIARRKLGLDDDTYEKFLRSIIGRTSTNGATDKELYLVVQALKKSGYTVGRPDDASQADDEQSLLVRHLWLKLKGYGELRNSSEWSLLKYVKRIAKVDRLEWVKPKAMQTLIETLKNWVARIERALVLEALESGKLVLPYFCQSLEDVEGWFKIGWGALDPKAEEALRSFCEEWNAYLATYTPPKPAKARGKAA